MHIWKMKKYERKIFLWTKNDLNNLKFGLFNDKMIHYIFLSGNNFVNWTFLGQLLRLEKYK